MKNLILIGMPGAGKSTVGVVLAKQQGYHFVDSDLVIQEQTGLLLHEIIEQQGDDGFRQVENRINADLAVKHSVIATGGSVIYGREAMQHLKKNRCCNLSEAVVRIDRGASGRSAQTRHYAAGGTDAAAALR